MSILLFFGVVLGLIVPLICIIGSIALLVLKIIERKKEKKDEDLDKYKKY